MNTMKYKPNGRFLRLRAPRWMMSKQIRSLLAVLVRHELYSYRKKPKPLGLLVSKELLSIEMCTHTIKALANTLIHTNIHFKKKKKDQIAYLIIYETHLFLIGSLSSMLSMNSLVNC